MWGEGVVGLPLSACLTVNEYRGTLESIGRYFIGLLIFYELKHFLKSAVCMASSRACLCGHGHDGDWPVCHLVHLRVLRLNGCQAGESSILIARAMF